MEQASWNLMFPGTYFLIGLILFGVSSFILSFMDSFQGGISSLTWMGRALGLTLLLVNRQLVLDETLPGNDQPVLERRVLRYNRWFILVLSLLVAVVAFAACGSGSLIWREGSPHGSPDGSAPVQSRLRNRLCRRSLLPKCRFLMKKPSRRAHG